MNKPDKVLTEAHKAKLRAPRKAATELVLNTVPVKGTKKLLAGLEWLTDLGPGKHRLSAMDLRANISKDETPSGKLLRTCLTTVGGYQPGVRNTEYVVEEEQLFKLRARYFPKETFPEALSTARAKHRYMSCLKLELFKTGIPRSAGKRVGHRFYTPITSMESEVRTALIKRGFDYDIQASMATLLYQRYLKAGGTVLPAWQSLVQDRTKFRAELAEFSGIAIPSIKKIIASLINGGQLVRHSENSIWQIFRVSHAHVVWDDFIEHRLVQGLLKDGKTLYETLVPKSERQKAIKLKDDGSSTSRVKSRGWHQYQLYEQTEDEIMSVVADILAGQDIWYVHDGFMSRSQIAADKFREITDRVQELTGYAIQFEETELKGE